MSLYEKIGNRENGHSSMLRLRIRNMETRDDYKTIIGELLKQGGIEKISPYKNGSLLSITYRPNLISKETITYVIITMGYRIARESVIDKPFIKNKGG